MKTAEVFKIRKSMSLEQKLEDRVLEKAFNSTMGDLADKLPTIKKSMQAKSEKDQKNMILQKSFELLKEQKLSIIDCGIIESRLNKGQELSKAHRDILGLDVLKKSDSDIIDSFHLPKKPVTSGMLEIDQVDEIEKLEDQGIEREADFLSAHKQIGDYSFINIKGDTITVSRAEILRAVGKAFKAGKLDLVTAGQVEYRLNHGGKLSDSILRYLFE